MDDKKPNAPEFVDDPDAPASDEERALSERLRDALDDPNKANESADLARALSLGVSPRELSADEHRAIVADAVAKMKPASNVVIGAFGRRRAAVVVGVATALSLAAGAILLLGQMTSNAPERTASLPASAAPLAQTRSTQPLFEEPFARTGGASARIDRIAIARSSDLRENRFAKWGVR